MHVVREEGINQPLKNYKIAQIEPHLGKMTLKSFLKLQNKST
jgi:hypothetical protein